VGNVRAPEASDASAMHIHRRGEVGVLLFVTVLLRGRDAFKQGAAFEHLLRPDIWTLPFRFLNPTTAPHTRRPFCRPFLSPETFLPSLSGSQLMGFGKFVKSKF
jgi:hypothetical protein